MNGMEPAVSPEKYELPELVKLVVEAFVAVRFVKVPVVPARVGA
jgi:hypothetical protein